MTIDYIKSQCRDWRIGAMVEVLERIYEAAGGRPHCNGSPEALQTTNPRGCNIHRRPKTTIEYIEGVVAGMSSSELCKDLWALLSEIKESLCADGSWTDAPAGPYMLMGNMSMRHKLNTEGMPQMPSQKNTTAAAIKKLRIAKKMSQQAFADSVGVPKMTVYRWETGTSSPNLLSLKKISDAFDVPVDDLM